MISCPRHTARVCGTNVGARAGVCLREAAAVAADAARVCFKAHRGGGGEAIATVLTGEGGGGTD